MYETKQLTQAELDKDARLMKQGQKIFIKELRKQIDLLRELLKTIETRPTFEDLRHLYRIVHTLKGSAPIFGYTRIGRLSEELVRIWEWTQSELETGLIPAAAFSPIETSLKSSKQALRELNMEYEISQTELSIDELNKQHDFPKLGTLNCRLLIIDDDDVLRTFMQQRLQLDGCLVDVAADVDSAKKMLREHIYDLVILDLMMHPQSGYELFEYLKEDPTLKWMPIIVLSVRSDLNDKIRCFHLGADDYVTKPFQYEELSARIYSLMKRAKSFEQLAFRDPLTGAFNRRYFDHQVSLDLQRAERYLTPISLVFIDIDRFKSINDTYGHHVGDLVLQGLAHLLQSNLRSTDLLARFGGEEFVIVLPGTHVENGIKVIENILELARKQPVAQNEGQSFHITFSAGVAEWHESMSIHEWVKLADSAMYNAKQQGRNRVLGVQEGAVQEHREAAAVVTDRKRLLLADDDHILRSMLLAHLEHLPIHIVEAADGEEAFNLLLEQKFDAVILDGIMPKMDGFGLLEHIKAHQELSKQDLKVLMLSGKKHEDDLVKGFQLGADDYMTKPFSLIELEMRVRRLLKL
jgi:two-component system cell cycle response regulator